MSSEFTKNKCFIRKANRESLRVNFHEIYTYINIKNITQKL